MENVHIGPVTEYSPELVDGINRLLQELDPKFADSPITREILEERIRSNSADQFVATLNGEVIGCGVMSVVHGSLAKNGKRGHLEDFVTDESWRGHGIGSKLWLAFIEWCRQKELVAMGFDTETYRPDALNFYINRGAEVLEANRFLWVDLTKLDGRSSQ